MDKLAIGGIEFEINGNTIVPFDLATSPKNYSGNRGITHLLWGKGPRQFFLKTACGRRLWQTRSLRNWELLIGKENPKVKVNCQVCRRIAKLVLRYGRKRKGSTVPSQDAVKKLPELACKKCEVRYQVGRKDYISYWCPECQEKLVRPPGSCSRWEVLGFLTVGSALIPDS